MAWEVLDRMERAVARVRERLLRVTAVLNKAGVPYAVVGGHAVASWVTTVFFFFFAVPGLQSLLPSEATLAKISEATST